MNSPTRRVHFGDYSFNVWDNVYEPAEDSFFFAENLLVQEDAKVLDIGTGCGILGILAAKKASIVLAVDVNPYAISCAKENAKINHVQGKMAFVRGSLFTCLSDEAKFDVILFNAPYLPTEKQEAAEHAWLAYAWDGGVTGRKVIDRFIIESHRYLALNGQILLLQSTLADVDKTLLGFSEQKMNARVVASHALPFFETLILIKATRTT